MFKDIVTNLLSGPRNDIVLQVKIDGSPSCFFGTDPLDSKFFVATKGLFNKNPKLVKSQADARKMFHGDLGEKMATAFGYLVNFHINPDLVYQSDILFTGRDKKMAVIDGQKYVTFKPNVLVYAVSPSLKELYNNIITAKLGLVVHTMYRVTKRDAAGFSLSTIPFSFRSITTQSGGDVFITDNVIKGTHVAPEASDILNWLVPLQKDVNKGISVLDELTKRDVQLPIYIKTFINAQLDKQDIGIFGDAKNDVKFNGDKYFGELLDFVIGAYERDAGVKNVGEFQILKDRMVKVLLKYKYQLILVLFVYYNMIKIKNRLLDMFRGQGIFSRTFKEISGQYKETPDEGIVILAGDNIVKLVDRTEFSKMNRMAHRS